MNRRALLAALAAWPLLQATRAVADPIGAASSVRLVLDAHGSITLDGQGVTEATLGAAARALVARRPGVEVVIVTHESVRYATVVHLMDVLQAAGITRLSFGELSPPAGS